MPSENTVVEKKPNELINEKSPYLLQHAYNPVNWYPWSDVAFIKAKEENKPVFVSIGYSTCHWCHVMEKECFDDTEVARLMNETFVSIKVDREERPDLDGIYMMICQMMGRNCGWPLNVIMTPDRKPFFITSYIPKQSRFGLMGMMELIPQIQDIWQKRRTDLEKVGDSIKQRIVAFENRPVAEELDEDVLDDAYEKLTLRFDEVNAGFGSAPKFPSPHNLLFLLKYWKRTDEKNGLVMVEKTLRAMHLGGIFDQIGFGFHRYSTDAEWIVPHFEKMLYDQALLILAYAEAYQATKTEDFKTTITETLQYLLRDLASSEGGFYSAEDADSEGEEGKFYLWSVQEIQDVLSPEDASLATKIYSIEAGGNYFDPTKNGRNGKNILHLSKPLIESAKELNMTVDELFSRISKIQQSLYKVRQKRVHPAKDDKILTDWNGLTIAALAKAGSIMNEPKYLEVAIKAANFFLEKMREQDILFHRFVKGERAIEGFLDDYAFLVWGLIEIYEASFEEKYLTAALELTDAMIARFWDKKDGGFYFTSINTVDVMMRRKEIYDGAYPSGNSVALLNLLRLARLESITRYEEIAARLNRTFAGDVKSSPSAYTFFLLGVDFIVGPSYNVIFVGEANAENTVNLLQSLRKNYLPNLVVKLNAPNKAGFGYEMINGKTTVYVCRNQICLPPTNEKTKMLELLNMTS